MEYETFLLLVLTLRVDISIDIARASVSAPDVDPIFPELITAIGLRFLKGGRTQDIRDWAGISTSTYHRCINKPER